MTETLDLEPQAKLDTAGKRALIEQELRSDPNRSDREIARTVGNAIDHKTVGAARERMGIATHLGNSPPTPTERRAMLIAGAEDFMAKHPEQHDGTTAEEAVDAAVATGKISLAPDEPEIDTDLCWHIPHQALIECRPTNDGTVEIWQKGQLGPDDDQRIDVAPRNAVALARRILWAAGFKSVGIFAYVKGGGCVDLEDGDEPDSVRTEPVGYGPVRP
ncbi:hypothetical protein [Bradyrhizobium sp. SSUT77]|uniref:hypothetical protein n=1 Tax=Bradyrhizobium sp. SSUT77 TaxID=3040603 RepID=UPI00244ABE01|nr:hypothetical protein [Bradyrhizobium sp. SSUT77]MDH2343249.1 hypothetical protein [Bradyrhizobium sp. SSUT77]